LPPPPQQQQVLATSSIIPSTLRSSPSSLRTALREQEAKALGELNECLAILGAIFPDVQPQVFREMLQTFSKESRLELITEAMLNHQVKWVRGRWRVPDTKSAPASTALSKKPADNVPIQEQFRTMEYKNAVKLALYDEFKGLGRASIKAVLAENNYSYIEARQALLEVVSTSWRYAISNFLFRRKVPVAEEHPLLRWDRHSRQPQLMPTASEELDEELKEAIIAPLQRNIAEKIVAQDRALAIKLNEDQAEAAEATFDCECCFTSSTFEEIAACDTGSHFICFRCIRHTMNEALYGQGWAKTFDANKCSLRCIAMPTGSDSCSACIPFELVERAVVAEPKGEETIRKFQQRAMNDSLQKSHLRIRQCPSCAYAEAEETPKEARRHENLLTTAIIVAAIMCAVNTFCFDLDMLQLICTYLGLFFTLRYLAIRNHFNLPPALHPSTHNQPPTPAHLNNGTKFICRSPTCLTTTCLRCLAPWTDPHTCYTSTRLALQTYVDSAVSSAIKRTCPQCNLSFIKSSGCNKLVCVCGYAMCYICRSDIGKEGYMHFCQHFRAEPGMKCAECERCDLYLEEEEKEVLERARARAVSEWREMQKGGGRGVDGLEEVEKEVLGRGGGSGTWGDRTMRRRAV